VHLAYPTKTDVLLLMGAIHYQLKNFDQCVVYNDQCILLDPTMAEAHANLANALQQLGNIDMAIVYYQASYISCLGWMNVPLRKQLRHLSSASNFASKLTVDTGCSQL
jgi:tetratricopeptide (TPR) repeat protein